MPDDIVIRGFVGTDAKAIMSLYPRAFPDEDLTRLVAELLGEPCAASLVAEADGEVVGHVAVTDCRIDRSVAVVSLLGPLAVAPERQRSGIGSKLAREGLARSAARGASGALVLGDPDYYRRFGFEAGHGVETPFPIPAEWAEAWRFAGFGGDAPAGRLKPPAPWLREALWAA